MQSGGIVTPLERGIARGGGGGGVKPEVGGCEENDGTTSGRMMGLGNKCYINIRDGFCKETGKTLSL